MRKKLLIAVLVVSATYLTQFGVFALDQKANEVKNHIEQLELENEKTKENLDEAMIEGRRLYDENQKLEQEIKNLKALQEKEEELRVSYNRGSFSYIVYDEYSRIDVPSDISAEKLDQAFEGTNMEGLGAAFVEAERTYGINAIFLSSIAVLESGWGSSDYSIYRNNIFGYGSYDYDPNQTIYFDTVEQGIDEVGKFLVNAYLATDGQYYNGATPTGVNTRYSSSDVWCCKVVEIMNLIVERATS